MWRHMFPRCLDPWLGRLETQGSETTEQNKTAVDVQKCNSFLSGRFILFYHVLTSVSGGWTHGKHLARSALGFLSVINGVEYETPPKFFPSGDFLVRSGDIWLWILRNWKWKGRTSLKYIYIYIYIYIYVYIHIWWRPSATSTPPEWVGSPRHTPHIYIYTIYTVYTIYILCTIYYILDTTYCIIYYILYTTYEILNTIYYILSIYVVYTIHYIPYKPPPIPQGGGSISSLGSLNPYPLGGRGGTGRPPSYIQLYTYIQLYIYIHVYYLIATLGHSMFNNFVLSTCPRTPSLENDVFEYLLLTRENTAHFLPQISALKSAKTSQWCS